MPRDELEKRIATAVSATCDMMLRTDTGGHGRNTNAAPKTLAIHERRPDGSSATANAASNRTSAAQDPRRCESRQGYGPTAPPQPPTRRATGNRTSAAASRSRATVRRLLRDRQRSEQQDLGRTGPRRCESRSGDHL
ncbi:MAG TPA: hypothetical protein ENJ18_09490 [Nannocystis exedens]|nr:hypothetical protein [Nannocystis exedens]